MTEIVFDIDFHGPFRVPRGEASAGADAIVDRDNPLPGSSLKGLMRAAAAQLLGVKPPWLSLVFGPSTEENRELEVRQAGSWSWSSAHFESVPAVGRSARVKMTDRGAVDDHHLQIGEQHWATRAWFSVSYLGPSDEDLADHRLILRAAARAVTALGGQRRRGQGWVTIRDRDRTWTDGDSQRLITLAPPGHGGTETASAATTLPLAAGGPLTRLIYRLRTTAMISAGVGAEVGNTQHGHLVIPGSTIRGALAAAWMQDHGLRVADRQMAEVFERDISVGPAIPVGSRLEPVSAQRPKYGKGPSRDRAVEVARGEVPDDWSKVEEGRGWSVPDTYRTSATRTALNANGTAAESKLYTAEGLRTGTVLVGELVVPATSDDLRQWLSSLRTLRVGGRRSVGGTAEFELVPDIPPAEPGAPVSGGRVALRLNSPAILVDDIGSPTVDLGAALRRDLDEPELQVIQTWIRTTRIEGWHAASGLPKPAELAVAAGSVVVVSGLTAAGAARLIGGVGLRRQEGFGRIEIVGPDEPPFGAAVRDPAPVVESPPVVEPPPAGDPADDGSDNPPAVVEARPSIETRVDALVRSISASGLAGFASGLEEMASRIADQRAAGTTKGDKIALGMAEMARSLPWLRGQPSELQQQTVELLRSPQVAEVRDRARAIRRERWA